MALLAAVPQRRSLSVDTISELDEIPSSDLVDGDLAFIAATEQYWRISKSSSATASTTVRVANSGGRWIRVFLSSMGYSVADLTELAALDTSQFELGSNVYVESLKCNWTLILRILADGETIINALDATQSWSRQPTQSWEDTTTFYVALAGTVEGAGTALDPITFAEVQRRMEGATRAVNLTVYVSDSVGDGPVAINLPPLSNIYFEGVPSQLGTGTLSAVTPINHGANQGFEIEVAAFNDASGWEGRGYLYKILRMTSGARAGWCAGIIADLGGGVARITPLLKDDHSLQMVTSVADGETFEVIDLPAVGQPKIADDRLQSFIVYSRLLSFETDFNYVIDENVNAIAYFESCLFPPTDGALTILADGSASFYACVIYGDPIGFHVAEIDVNQYGAASFFGTAIVSSYASIYVYDADTQVNFYKDSTLQGGGNLYSSTFVYGPKIYVSDLGVFDSTYTGIFLSNFGLLNIAGTAPPYTATVYGNSNNSPIFSFAKCARGVYQSAAALTATMAAGQPLSIDGVAHPWGDLPFIDVALATSSFVTILDK